MYLIEKLYKLKRMIVKRIIYIYKTYFTSDGKYKSLLSDRLYIMDQYKKIIGKKPDLKNPKTFSEKLNWLKLYDRRPEYRVFVDKFAVRDYVAKTIGEEYLIPLLGVWDNPEDIDIMSLPEKFVLKCNHDSGGVVICREKSSFDFGKAKEKLNLHIKRNFYKLNREWPYKNLKKKIIAETFLTESDSDGIRDYKFFCINGEPRFLYISDGLEDHSTASISFVSLDWEYMPFKRTDFKQHDSLPKKPQRFDDMISLSKTLAKDYPFIRVDFYSVDDKIYFSELTLYPCAGMLRLKPEEWDRILGDWLELPNKKKRG